MLITRKISTLVLAVMLCMPMSGIAQASGAGAGPQTSDVATSLVLAEGISPFWSNTSSLQITLSIKSGKASCSGIVIGQPGTNKITGSATLARQNENGTFTNVKTWKNLSVDGDILTFEGTYYVSKGYTYRLTITATVYRNGYGEPVSGLHETNATR